MEMHDTDPFKGKFDDFEVTPSLNSFNSVLNKLEAARKKKRRRAFAYVLSGIAGSGLLLLLLPHSQPVNPPRAISIAAAQQKTSPSLSENHAQEKQQEAHTKPAGETVVKQAQQHEQSESPSATKEPNSTLNLSSGHPVATVPAPAQQPTSRFQQAPQEEHSQNTFRDQEPGPAKNPDNTAATGIPEIAAAPSQHTDNALISQAQNNATAQVESSYLEPVAIKPDKYNSAPEMMPLNHEQTEKQLLNLKASAFKTVFFAGITYMPLLYAYSYSKNPNTNDVYKTGYSTDFNDAYINNRKAARHFNLQGIPGIRAGFVLRNRLEISASLGYYRLNTKETVMQPPVDTTAQPVPNFTISTLGNPGPTFGAGRLPATNADELGDGTYKNSFSYLFGAIDISGILSLGNNFSFKPGISIALNRVMNASYVLVDTSGYSYQENKTYLLNETVYNVCIKAGFSKKIGKIEMQLSPAVIVSPSSVFNGHYFIRQKMYGFGLEGALLYRFGSGKRSR